MNASITRKHSSRMCTAHLLTRRGFSSWNSLHSTPFMAPPFMEPPFMALPFTVSSFHRTPLHGTQFYRSPFHSTPFISPTPRGQHHPPPRREQNESQVQKHYLAPNFAGGNKCFRNTSYLCNFQAVTDRLPSF